MQKKINYTQLVLVAIILFIVFGYILNPLLNLGEIAVKSSSIVDAFFWKRILKAATNSVLLSLFSVVGSSIIGIYFAYTLHYKKIWFKALFSNLLLLPIAIPPMVGVMSYLFLMDENGFLMKLFSKGTINFTGWTAILIVHIYSFYPLSYLFVGNNLKNIDSSIVEASYSLGASKFKTFYSIIFPQLLPSIISSSMLIFMASMASFSAPFIFGGSDTFLSTEIYYSKINGNMPLSALLSFILVAISLAVFFIFRLYSKKNTIKINSKGTIKRNELFNHQKTSYSASLFSIAFGILILLPLISLFLISILPENNLFQSRIEFSLKNYSAIFSDPDFTAPLINSVLSSLTAVFATLLISLGIANLIKGKQNFYKSALETSVILPYSIPGTVIAICLILSFNNPSVFSLKSILVGTFWILPIAYTIRNLPLLTQAIKTALQGIDPAIEEASKVLGASNFYTWKSIIFPLIYGATLEGTLLVFINSFGEFVATVLLYNASTKTIPIEIYAQIRMNNNGIAAAYGIILFLFILLIIFIIRKIKAKFSF